MMNDQRPSWGELFLITAFPKTIAYDIMVNHKHTDFPDILISQIPDFL